MQDQTEAIAEDDRPAKRPRTANSGEGGLPVEVVVRNLSETATEEVIKSALPGIDVLKWGALRKGRARPTICFLRFRTPEDAASAIQKGQIEIDEVVATIEPRSVESLVNMASSSKVAGKKKRPRAGETSASMPSSAESAGDAQTQAGQRASSKRRRVASPKRDSAEDEELCKVVLRKFPSGLTSQMVREAFAEIDWPVKRVHWSKALADGSRSACFVHLKNACDAQQALSRGILAVQGGRVAVEAPRQKAAVVEGAQSEENQSSKSVAPVVVRGFPKTITAEQIKSAFETAGFPVAMLRWSQLGEDGMFSACFVHLKEEKHAQDAISLGRLEVEGGSITITAFIPKSAEELPKVVLRKFPATLTEDQIRVSFAAAGWPVAKVQWSKPKEDGTVSTCFVQLTSKEDAEKAAAQGTLEVEGGTMHIGPYQQKKQDAVAEIHGAPLEKETAELDPVVIFGFPRGTTAEHVKQAFAEAKLPVVGVGWPKSKVRLCYVHLRSEEDVRKALEKGSLTIGEKVASIQRWQKKQDDETTRPDEPVKSKRAPTINPDTCKVVLREFSKSMTNEQVRSAFSLAGWRVLKVYWPRPKEDGSYSVCFVRLRNPEDVPKVLLQGELEIGGESVKIVPFNPKREDGQPIDKVSSVEDEAKMEAIMSNAAFQVVLRKFPATLTEDQIRVSFAAAGWPVAKVQWSKPKEDGTVSTCFVQLTSKEDAEKAAAQGTLEVGGGTATIRVPRAAVMSRVIWLYDFPASVSEEELRTAFKVARLSVAEMKLRRKQDGIPSSCEVHFKTDEDAKKARMKGYLDLESCRLRMEPPRMAKVPTSSGRGDAESPQVALRHFPSNVTHSGIKSAFNSAGLQIVKIHWPKRAREDGTFGICFVELHTQEDAQQALKLEHLIIDKKSVTIEAPRRREKANDPSPELKANLQVVLHGFPETMTEKHVKTSFGKAGWPVAKVQWSRPKKDGRILSCFVQLNAADDVATAISQGSIKINECDVTIEEVKPREQPSEQMKAKTYEVIVRNLPATLTDDHVKSAFEKERWSVTKVHRPSHSADTAAGFCFVHMKNLNDAEEAVAKGSLDVEGNTLTVHAVKEKNSGDEKQRHEVRLCDIPTGTTEEQMKSAIADAGWDIARVSWRKPKDEGATPVCYVQFKTCEAAAAAASQVALPVGNGSATVQAVERGSPSGVGMLSRRGSTAGSSGKGAGRGADTRSSRGGSRRASGAPFPRPTPRSLEFQGEKIVFD
eukprot:NODE_46_length_3847_cov_15.272512_g40_i0.p1 GENE.NODE_46_length_3847_cov_15.272512_g40_i0~~NODE_46_length_3847_cov_15.272512_g40_i0.p1  ORF type:complete len:1239 (-),score=237.61 NODE_46_length_3847_cov_15.272512_g40_i0:53-3769(-)